MDRGAGRSSDNAPRALVEEIRSRGSLAVAIFSSIGPGLAMLRRFLRGSRYPVIKGKPEFPSPGTSLLGVNPHGKGWNCLVAFSHRLTDSLNEERVMPTEPLDGKR